MSLHDMTPFWAGGPREEDLPAWQKGYPLGVLKSLRALFAAWDEGQILGAFTGAKERTIADWIAGGRLYCFGRAAIVARIDERASSIKDFTGEKRLSVPPGALRIERIAAEPGGSAQLRQLLEAAASGFSGPIILEGWLEHPKGRALAEELGLELAAVKIRASSELVGIWARGCQSAPLDPAERIGIAELPFPNFVAERLAAELDAFEIAWEDHYSGYNLRRSWSAISLRSFGGSPSFIEKPAEMSKRWKAEHPEALAWEPEWTELADRFPACRALAESLPGGLERVRLMRLAPGGGELARHADITDRDAGIADGKIARIHFPIRTNPEVVFSTWDLEGRRHDLRMRPGAASYLDVRKPHTAINGGEAPRIHLVADYRSGPELRGLLASAALAWAHDAEAAW